MTNTQRAHVAMTTAVYQAVGGYFGDAAECLRRADSHINAITDPVDQNYALVRIERIRNAIEEEMS